jgi:hypothetical protein
MDDVFGRVKANSTVGGVDGYGVVVGAGVKGLGVENPVVAYSVAVADGGYRGE